MSISHPRVARERKTVETMIGLYCHGHHGVGDGLCEGCESLLDYARQRLQTCPFQEGKTTCAKCLVHCYNQEMRAKIRAVMRYAGPRMPYTHPIMALWHLVDGRRSTPVGPGIVASKQVEQDKSVEP